MQLHRGLKNMTGLDERTSRSVLHPVLLIYQRGVEIFAGRATKKVCGLCIVTFVHIVLPWTPSFHMDACSFLSWQVAAICLVDVFIVPQ